MESMRDINRVMEREIAKGSCPLKQDHIEFGDYSYQEITSKEKLLEVLSYLLRIGDFSQYAGKTILNNVYMDLRGKKPVFKRTRTAMERNNIFATIKRYAKKLKPQYNGDVYLERCRSEVLMQEEVTQKTIALVIKTAKLDANVLKVAMRMYLNHSRQKAQKTHGKTSVKKLVGGKRQIIRRYL